MIENRRAWLDRLLSASIEGGYVNDPDDTGGATNLGITAATLGSWRKLGRVATEEEVKDVTREEAEAIALAMYWNAMRADQLPGGIDIYAADFSFGSGPGNASRVLQEIVGTTVDGFVGDQTMTAVRARDPRQLLDEYDDARMAFLRKHPRWAKYGGGWSDRCRQMVKLARTKLQARPVLAEMLPSKTALGGIVAALGGLVSTLPSLGPALQGAVDQSNSLAAAPGIEGHVGAALAVIGGLYACWRRYHDWRTGQR